MTRSIKTQNGLLIMTESYIIKAGKYAGEKMESKTEVFKTPDDAGKEAGRAIQAWPNLVLVGINEVTVDGVTYFTPGYNVFD